MFIQRAAVTLVIGPLLLLLVYWGGLAYFLPIVIFLAIATIEYSQMLDKMGLHVPVKLLLPLVSLQWISAQWPSKWLTSALAVGLLAVMAYALWLYERREKQAVTADWQAMIAGLMLLGWLGGHFFKIRGLPDHAWQWTMIALLGTWLADSAAYVVGRFLAGRGVLGRHQLSPRLSPNKTVEGYVGGVLIATALITAVATALDIPMWAGFVCGILTSAVSPLGDLGISLLKREAGVKDSGNVLPGHGGALDRIDSLVWSVTLVYYFALLLS